MAVNVSKRSGNVKNIRSHSRKASKARQKLNLQVVTLENGKKARKSVQEIRTENKAKKAA